MFVNKQFVYELFLHSGGMQMQSQKSCLEAAIKRRHTGLVCKILHGEFRKRFEENARRAGVDDVTITHGRILGFLARAGQNKVFQRDIEQEFHINRSTVTGLMKTMEKNGLVQRHMVANDNRLRQVVLSEKGFAMHAKSMFVIEQTERQMLQGIDQREIAAFFETVQKIQRNLEREG